VRLWSPTALACSAEVASATKAGQPWFLLSLRRNPSKHVLLAKASARRPEALADGSEDTSSHPSPAEQPWLPA
jgi:hypothetical protein